MSAISSEFFAQQNIDTVPNIRSQTEIHEYDFSIARAYILLSAVLIIPLHLTLFMLNYSVNAL